VAYRTCHDIEVFVRRPSTSMSTSIFNSRWLDFPGRHRRGNLHQPLIPYLLIFWESQLSQLTQSKMLYPISILSLILLLLIHLTNAQDIPFSTRAYWMRHAISALSQLDSPCPFAAFGKVVVNHTGTSVDQKGALVCMGINSNARTGNPTLHGKWRNHSARLTCPICGLVFGFGADGVEKGEIAAIHNCSSILTDSRGAYYLSSGEALEAFRDLSLYTTAEACPMVYYPFFLLVLLPFAPAFTSTCSSLPTPVRLSDPLVRLQRVHIRHEHRDLD
jgi:tRNA(Arg) A34 adenosine deaminase TadA